MADIEKGPGARDASGPFQNDHLRRGIEGKFTGISITPQLTDLYCRDTYIGSICHAVWGFWARTDGGENLGLFNTIDAAARALVAAALHMPGG